METWMFVLIWIFVFIALLTFLPGIFYIISLLFNWFKPEKKVKKDVHYSLSQFKEIKGSK